MKNFTGTVPTGLDPVEIFLAQARSVEIPIDPRFAHFFAKGEDDVTTSDTGADGEPGYDVVD